MKLIILLVVSLNAGGVKEVFVATDVKHGCPDLQELNKRAQEVAAKHELDAVTYSQCVPLETKEVF